MRFTGIYRALVALLVAEECSSWVGSSYGAKIFPSSIISRLSRKVNINSRVSPSLINLHMAADTIISPFDSTSGQPATAAGAAVLEIVRFC